MRIVYMDNNATTPVDPRVKKAVLPYLGELFGNPSSLHAAGTPARAAVDKARQQVANVIGAEAEEIFFTASGTEADNWAIKGAYRDSKKSKKHIITSSVEHEAVRNTCKFLMRQGIDVTFLPVDQYAMVDPDEVRRAIRPETVLITIMHSNNEVGTLQPIAEITKIAREAGIIMHTDAVQSVCKVPLDVKELGVDMMAMSGHKLYALKGCGALYIKSGTRVRRLIHGGHQEGGKRAGTENVVGIVALGEGCKLALEQHGVEPHDICKLRDRLEKGILEQVPHTKLNGHPKERLCSTANIRFEYLEGESILLRLSAKGICVSTGSACSSESLEPSPVLLAMGIQPQHAHGAIRFSLGRMNTEDDVDYVLEQLPPIIEELRKMSPLFPG
ncbi:MAG TPA: cysteine desulfurase NifS [bacterium]|nr:cysteine desulfurase NifS [bacterium]